MESCENFRELITELAAGTLDGEDLARAGAHARECAACAAYLDEVRSVVDAVRAYGEAVPEPSREYIEGLADRVHAQARGGATAEGGEKGRVVRVTFRGALWRAAAAAAALAILVFGFYSSQHAPDTGRVAKDAGRRDVARQELSKALDAAEEQFGGAFEEFDMSAALDETDEMMAELAAAGGDDFSDEDIEWVEQAMADTSAADATAGDIASFVDSLTEEEAEYILDSLGESGATGGAPPAGVS